MLKLVGNCIGPNYPVMWGLFIGLTPQDKPILLSATPCVLKEAVIESIQNKFEWYAPIANEITRTNLMQIIQLLKHSQEDPTLDDLLQATENHVLLPESSTTESLTNSHGHQYHRHDDHLHRSLQLLLSISGN